MNIGFFKLGRSILFNKSKWSTIGGDNEAPILISKIAELNPKDNFYLLGASDLNKNLSIVPKNIKSLYKSKIKFNELKEKIEMSKRIFLLSGEIEDIIDYSFSTLHKSTIKLTIMLRPC